MASCFYKKVEYTSAENIYSGILKEQSSSGQLLNQANR